MWKNFMVQYRHRVQTLIQILLPVAFSICLIIIRSFVKPTVYPYNTTYKSFDPATLESLRALEENGESTIKEWRLVYWPKNAVLDALLTNVSETLELDEPPEGVETPEEVESVMMERFLLCGVLFDNYPSVIQVFFNQKMYKSIIGRI